MFTGFRVKPGMTAVESADFSSDIQTGPGYFLRREVPPGPGYFLRQEVPPGPSYFLRQMVPPGLSSSIMPCSNSWVRI